LTGYSGATNLEAMLHAVKYNAFLTSLVIAHAKQDDVVVDLGAGLGAFAQEMKLRNYKVLCVEPDESQARTIAAAGLPVVADEAESVDYLYSLNVLEHIDDDRVALREMHARLRVGGRLLIYVPAFQCLFSSMDREVGHYRRYRRAELTRKVTEAGFLVLESKYADSAGFVASLLYRLSRRKDGQMDVRALRAFDRWIFPLSLVGDRLFNRLFGKNAYVVAVRESQSVVSLHRPAAAESAPN
jgi:SAM-dependent methyltransferase